ncbi:DUF432 domain-containing protein [bacterium]|nr:DUF432 domain-containing protein [candidate division CSSED10-310 bacterium]
MLRKVGITMYGPHSLPWIIDQDDISIRIERMSSMIAYHRHCGERTLDKRIAGMVEEVVVHPVEPMLIHRHPVQFLLIHLASPIQVAARTTTTIYGTFPLDIAVMTSDRTSDDPIDVFSAAPMKLTLYGSPDHGMLCRYWISPIEESPPETRPLQEGVLRLTLRNDTPRWTQISRVVLRGYDMKLFFDDTTVSMLAVMRIVGKNLAETDTENNPLRPGMTRSTELMAMGIVKAISRKFMMEGDL